jgi:hypothetical protein
VTLLDTSRKILAHDIDPQFLESFSLALAWEYDRLYEDLRARAELPVPLKQEQFAERRGSCAVNALLKACKKHGVPFNFRKLDCNGQHKLLVKIGRVVLIQEPMLELTEKPRAADYKRELAGTHGLIRQLELNLGDQPSRILDWSGDLLGVILHGCSGPKFSRDHCSLGGLMLAIPDSAYSMWVMRLDLQQVAMFGLLATDVSADAKTQPSAGVQTDNVVATLKDKKQAI